MSWSPYLELIMDDLELIREDIGGDEFNGYSFGVC
jgi:hypothetical protein